MNKREKKFEKKLDMKLEKLENKTKKIIEKKQHTLWGYKKVSKVVPPVVSTSEDASSYNNTASAVASAPTELIMDATPLEEYHFVPHVVRGELVSQVWQVINNGQMPWTNEVIVCLITFLQVVIIVLMFRPSCVLLGVPNPWFL